MGSAVLHDTILRHSKDGRVERKKKFLDKHRAHTQKLNSRTKVQKDQKGTKEKE
jgi:hypothetical protein